MGGSLNHKSKAWGKKKKLIQFINFQCSSICGSLFTKNYWFSQNFQIHLYSHLRCSTFMQFRRVEEVVDRHLTPPSHLLGSKESVPNESPSFRRDEMKKDGWLLTQKDLGYCQ